MPLAIVAAEECIDDSNKCNAEINHYVELLTKNLDTDDWDLRYFAAQTYVDLYSRTNDIGYLNKAYKLVLDNVNYLIDEQKKQNSTYIAEIKKKEEPKGATKQEKKEIKEYNKMIAEERKTKLPSIYEPLYLNCDLLFALADELQISESEQQRIEKILHGSSRKDSLFLVKALNDKYYFEVPVSNENDEITYEKGKLIVPVSMISDKGNIRVTIGTGMAAVTADDWKIEKVEREKSGDISTFKAVFTSDKAKKATYNDGTKVEVEITPVKNSDCPNVNASFKTNVTKKAMFTNYEFERID